MLLKTKLRYHRSAINTLGGLFIKGKIDEETFTELANDHIDRIKKLSFELILKGDTSKEVTSALFKAACDFSNYIQKALSNA